MKNFIVSTFAEKRVTRGKGKLAKPIQRMVRVTAANHQGAAFAAGAIGVSNRLPSADFGLCSSEHVFNTQMELRSDWSYTVVTEDIVDDQD